MEHRKKSLYHINDRKSWFSANKIRCLCPDCEEVERIAHDNLSEQILSDSYLKSIVQRDKEREKEDKLWLLFAKGLVLFVLGYALYHICLALLKLV
jgi:hypothetical protein